MEQVAAQRDGSPEFACGSTPSDDKPAEKHRETRFDAHLVMNVLNQMAAEDFRTRGVEDPALFALSDYLQEVFRQQASSRTTLADEVRLVETYLNLYARVHGCKLDLNISMSGNLAGRPADRCLFQFANCVLGATRPKFGGQWQMRFAMEADSELETSMRVVVHVQAVAGESQSIDLPVAQKKLADIESGGHPPLKKIVWTQQQPTDLQLECTVLQSV